MSELQNAPHTPLKPMTVIIEPMMMRADMPITEASASAELTVSPYFNNTRPVDRRAMPDNCNNKIM